MQSHGTKITPKLLSLLNILCLLAGESATKKSDSKAKKASDTPGVKKKKTR